MYKATKASLHIVAFPNEPIKMHNSLSSFAAYRSVSVATGLKRTVLYRRNYDKLEVSTERANNVGTLALTNSRNCIAFIKSVSRRLPKIRKTPSVRRGLRTLRKVMKSLRKSEEKYSNVGGHTFLDFQCLGIQVQVQVQYDKINAGELMRLLRINADGNNNNNHTLASAQQYFRQPEILQRLGIKAYVEYEDQLWIWHRDAVKMITNFSNLDGNSLAPDIEAQMLLSLRQLE